MAGFPGAAGSLVPAHNILSTDMASHVQLPIKKWEMQMKGSPLVFNYCTVSSLRLRLMTGSHFAEWKEEGRTEGKRIPSRETHYQCKKFLHLISIFINFFATPPSACFLNIKPRKYLAWLVIQIRGLVSSAGCQGHIS